MILNISVARIYLILLLGVSIGYSVPVQTKDIVWDGSSPFVIVIVTLIGVGLVGLIIWAIIFQEKQRQEKKVEHSEVLYRSHAKQYGLVPNEILELRRLLKPVADGKPDSVFNSVLIFEQAVDRECAELVRRWGATVKAENATLVIRTIRNKLGYATLPYELPIASTRNIDIGQFVTVSLPDTDKVVLEQAVVSEKNELTLTLRYQIGKDMYALGAIKNVTITFTRNGDGYYTVRMPVLQSSVVEGKMVLGHTCELDRNQLRKHVRMVLSKALKCRVIRRSSKSKFPAPGQMVEETTMVDIGGGGLAFVTEQELDPNDVVSLGFTLSRRKYSIKGTIVAVIPQEGKKGMRYKHRVSFVDAEQGDVERIVKYIFEKQREQVQLFSGSK